MISFSSLLQVLWTGLGASTYVILFAVAFSLVLKIIKIWNFAQGGFMSLSFYVMYAGYNMLHWPAWASILLGFAFTAAGGLVLERYGFRTLRARQSPGLTYFILTLVVSYFLIYLLAMIFGTEPVSLRQSILSSVNIVGGIIISDWEITAIPTTAVLLLALYLFIRYTREGQFMAAVADNADLASLYGINAQRTWIVTFLIVAVLLTAGMYLLGTRALIIPETPTQMMLFAVIATLLGGMGNIFGAAVAALVLSLLQGLSIFVIPSQWQGSVLYLFLFVTILFFPKGLNLAKLRKIKMAS